MKLNVTRFLTKVVLFLAITFLMIEFDCFGMLFEKTEKGEALKRRGELLARAHVVKLHRQSQEKKITKELLSSEFQQTKDNPITWVQTQDGDIKEINTWKIQQMRALHLLLLYQRGKNSKDEPVNASTIIRSWPLTLVSNAFDHLANGTFDIYYDDLKTEYDKTLKKEGKEEFGEGRLRILISAAKKVEATELSALLAAKMIPNELQKDIIPKDIVSSVCTYLKSELLKKMGKPFESPERVTTREYSIPGSPGHYYVACNRDFSHILLGKGDGRLVLLQKGEYEYTQVSLEGHPAGSKVVFIAFNTSGKRAISCDDRQNVFLWDIAEKKQIKRLVQDGFYSAAVFSQNGEHVIAASGQHLKVFDSAGGEEIKSIASIHGANIVSVTCHPDGKHIVSGGTHGSQHNVVLYNIETDIQTILHSSQEEALVAFSPFGNKIIYAFGKTIILGSFNGQSVDIMQHNIFYADFDPVSITFSTDEDYYVVFAKRESDGLLPNSALIVRKCAYREKQVLDRFFTLYSDGIAFLPKSPLFIMKNIHSLLLFDAEKHIRQLLLSPDRFATGVIISNGKEPSKQDVFIDKTGNNVIVFYDTHFTKWVLFQQKDLDTLNAIENKLNAAQSLLLYQMYLAKLKGSFFVAGKIFETLPDDIRDMALTYLRPKRPHVPEETGIVNRILRFFASWWS